MPCKIHPKLKGIANFEIHLCFLCAMIIGVFVEHRERVRINLKDILPNLYWKKSLRHDNWIFV